MDARDIEKIVDMAHMDNDIFKSGKKQSMFDLLSSFEDLCGLLFMASVLNPFALKQIVDQMDALNVALLWVDQLCSDDQEELLNISISEERYEQSCSLLREYAYPYSIICSGYISFSRSRCIVTVDDKCVTFDVKDDQNKSAWSGILREGSADSPDKIIDIIDSYGLIKASAQLREHVTIEDEALCYSLTGSMLDPYRRIAQQQWEITKTLPDNWKFEHFTIAEYKGFWIAITALCYVHFFACLSVQDPSIRLKNSTIIQSLDNIIKYVVSQTTMDRDKVETIVNYITFNPQKRNADIMYQPIVRIEQDKLIIAPMLFMGSRPERNLLAVVSSKHDSEYSREVNDLEGLMVSEIESYITSADVVKHRHLRDDLPDIDFAVYDRSSKSAMVFETKWFAAADSSKEVYAKEDEITHGCEQIESIMAYAMSDRIRFFRQVFGVYDGDTIDLFCCVVAKHNIRTQHKYVPVIDLDRLKELLSSYDLNSVFHRIRNHEYEKELPQTATLSYKDVKYAGFTFRIPAICYEEIPEL